MDSLQSAAAVDPAGWTGAALSAFAVSPWAFVALVAAFGIILVLREALRNNKVVSAFLGALTATTETRTLVEQIRKDQVESNKERVKQFMSQSHLNKKVDQRLARIESAQKKFVCQNATTCDLREVPHDNP